MPIGKNSIKRVENSGYSKVETAAPDMENSTVVSEKNEKTAKKPATTKKTEKKPTANTEKKPAAKKAPSKNTTETKAPAKKPAKKTSTAPKSTPKKADEVAERDGFVRYAFGEDLPVHLL